VQETRTTGLGMRLSGPVRTWSLEPGLSVWEDGHTLRAGSVENFRPTIKPQGMTTVTACATRPQLVRTAASGTNDDVQTPRDECCRGLPGDAASVFRIAASILSRGKHSFCGLPTRPSKLILLVPLVGSRLDWHLPLSVWLVAVLQSPGLAPAVACIASSSRQSVQCVQSPDWHLPQSV
jgi:hypothetical protein